jgi:hypothetical protein
MAGEDRRSRYAGSRRVAVVGAGGEEITMLVPRMAPEPRVNGSYEIRDSDRLDLLASTALGDSTRWWVLADANPWTDATQIETPGTIIRLPDE